MLDTLAETQSTEDRAELDLLLSCARTRLDPESSERVARAVHGGVDWDSLIASADRHYVMPLLYWNLSRVCAADVPRDPMDALQHRFRDSAQRNLLKSRELVRVLNLLAANGINALPMKGPVLAEAVYGQLALRQFDDLDVLIVTLLLKPSGRRL